MISVIFLFTKNFIIKLTLGLSLRYSYHLGDFHPDILIEAILIKKRVMVYTVLMSVGFASIISTRVLLKGAFPAGTRR